MAMIPMGGPPNGGMPPGPMPGGPMGPGPMPPGAQGGPPPEYLLQQMLAGQGPAPAPGPELMGALQQLLDSWPPKNPPYYIDLANVVAQFMG